MRAYARGSGYTPIYILENGMSHRRWKGVDYQCKDGLTRDRLLRQSLSETSHAVAEGLPIKGYLYWPLTDNYEWGSRQPCFELYAYDYQAGKIRDTDGLGIQAGPIYAKLAAALKSGDGKG